MIHTQNPASVFSFLLTSNILTIFATLHSGGGSRKLKGQVTTLKQWSKQLSKYFVEITIINLITYRYKYLIYRPSRKSERCYHSMSVEAQIGISYVCFSKLESCDHD